jgi:hypothetical protein
MSGDRVSQMGQGTSPLTQESTVVCIERESARHRPRHAGGSMAFKPEYEQTGWGRLEAGP